MADSDARLSRSLLYTLDPEFRFRPGDTVVLVGDRKALVRAAVVFRSPVD